MPVLVVLALVIVPIVELYLIIQVGQLLGVVPTLLVLVALSVLGGVLLRREGARTWRAFRTALDERRVPAAEVADGALVILGGSLLLTPGFATDVVGLLCVLPPSRAVLRRLLTGLVGKRLGAGGALAFGLGSTVGRGGRRPPPAPGSTRSAPGTRRPGPVVDGSIVDGSVVDGSVVHEGDDPGTPRRPDSGR